MFLIQYSKEGYINGESIQRVSFEDSMVRFTINGDTKNFFTVKPDYTSVFLNHLQALNTNIDNIETCYKRINGE